MSTGTGELPARAESGLPPSLAALYPFRPRRVPVEGGELSVVDEGAGPAIVFVHGNPSWSFLYRDLILALRGKFRCVAPDHLGCGLSDRQPEPLRMVDHSRNLRTVLDVLGVREYLLVAHDWGGAIGAHQAGLSPDQVRGMVFANTAAFPLKRMPWQIRLARVPLLGRILMEQGNLFATGAARQGVVQPLAPAVADGLLWPWIEPEARRAVSAFVHDIPWTKSHPTRPTIEETERNLVNLRSKPCLLPWGLRDFCFDEVFLEEWRIRFPDAEVLRFEDAGHYLFEDAGQELRERVVEFAASVFGSEA